MFQKIEKKLVSLTPAKAEKLLAFNTFKSQRKVDKRWVAKLANYINEDLFTTGHIVFAVYGENENKITYLLNGQHQSSAVLTSQKNIDVVVDKYLCPTMDDVSLLYRQVNNAKISTIQDLVKMEVDALGLNWPIRIASLVVSGAALKERMSQAHKNLKVELLKQYIKQGRFINSLFCNLPEDVLQKDIKHLFRSPVIHAILLTYEKSIKDSEIFWANVRDDNGLLRTMPEKKLLDFLRESNFDKGRGASGSNRRIVNHHEMTSRCIIAWNNYRRKKKIRAIIYHPTKPIPKAI